jgi:hypothetical protein
VIRLVNRPAACGTCDCERKDAGAQACPFANSLGISQAFVTIAIAISVELQGRRS